LFEPCRPHRLFLRRLRGEFKLKSILNMEEIIADVDFARLVEVDRTTLRIEKEPGFQAILPDPHGNDERHWLTCTLAAAVSERIMGIYHLRENYSLRPGIVGGDVISDVMYGIITNAEEHGNSYDDSKVTMISHQLVKKPESDLLEVVVRDEGIGFDYAHLQACEIKARGTRRSYNTFREKKPQDSIGQGLFYVLRVCDEVAWTPPGNEIKVRLRLERKVV